MSVKILPPDVIAKIAAGEVIERPAAVVKELIENALDAGADAIEIHLKDAGKELIHIKDNGCGISKDNIEKLFARHATSKIQQMEDLEKLSSMGFRGEALYSIAAVSDIVLRSKTEGKDAWEIQLQASKRLDLKPTALSSRGTEIKISQLFFNTPARRKFLKSTTAEMQQILNIVLPYTLLYPAKRFVLTHAGRSLLDLKPASSAADRMADALNVESNNLMEVTQEFADLKATVRLVLSNINVQRPRRDLQFIFVNNRPVENKNLSFNINDIYRLILPPGVYPAFLLDIQIDPADVDVNIHPTKREVRIRQEARIVSFVRHLTEYTLMQQGTARTIDDIRRGEPMCSPDTRADTQVGPYSNDLGQPQTFFNPISPAPSLARGFDTSHWQTAEDNLFKSDNTLQSKFARARYIGSFINKYLLFEVDQSLFLVDQHAAQERIMFEKFDKQMNEGTLEVQPLLTPILLKLSPAEKIAW
jgi:DNA mismatch repair protein MutL